MALSEDLFFDLRATIDEIERPWAAFIGLVDLRPSEYVTGDSIFAVNPPRLGLGLDAGQSVVLHPDTIPQARIAAHRLTRRDVSDAELAAMLYWVAHRRGHVKARGPDWLA